MKYLSANDGIDHINVYSKGKTELGRLLSNFAHTPFRIPFMGNFQSVEGFWYWYLTGNEHLRRLHGFIAKQIGKNSNLKFKHKETNFPKRVLRIAYRAKLKYHPKLKQMLLENNLPLSHYYVYSGKIVEPKRFEWTAKLWEEFKEGL